MKGIGGDSHAFSMKMPISTTNVSARRKDLLSQPLKIVLKLLSLSLVRVMTSQAPVVIVNSELVLL